MAARDVHVQAQKLSPRAEGPGSGRKRRETPAWERDCAKREGRAPAKRRRSNGWLEADLSNKQQPGSGFGQQPSRLGGQQQHTSAATPAVAASSQPQTIVSPGHSGQLQQAGIQDCAASPNPVSKTVAQYVRGTKDAGGGGISWQLAGISLEELPSWCDRPLVTRQHFHENVQVDAFCYLPGHPLVALAAEGRVALLRKVLQNGAEVDAKDSRGYSALHLACCHARLACVQVLLEAGASVQAEDWAGRTAAKLAQAAGHADVEVMLQQHEVFQQTLLEQQPRQELHQQQVEEAAARPER